MKRAWIYGLALWAVGTAGIRVTGQRILQPGHVAVALLLYAISFVLMALLIPRICRAIATDRGAQFQALATLLLPTLVLDALAALFFPAVYPNVNPATAGIFAGWMLICCGGAVVGLLARR